MIRHGTRIQEPRQALIRGLGHEDKIRITLPDEIRPTGLIDFRRILTIRQVSTVQQNATEMVIEIGTLDVGAVRERVHSRVILLPVSLSVHEKPAAIGHLREGGAFFAVGAGERGGELDGLADLGVAVGEVDLPQSAMG